MSNLLYLKNVTTLQLDGQKCTGCGMCLDVCPHNVLGMNGKHA
ncbi:MAG TPA: 4Fe-4S binding protein, partial [Smithellaceae bacterium]|nr:4Fe-4S binding protein [Smithellaceae bacterium]